MSSTAAVQGVHDVAPAAAKSNKVPVIALPPAIKPMTVAKTVANNVEIVVDEETHGASSGVGGEIDPTMQANLDRLAKWSATSLQGKTESMTRALVIMDIVTRHVTPAIKRMNHHLQRQEPPPKRIKSEHATTEENKKMAEEQQKANDVLKEFKEHSGTLVKIALPMDTIMPSCKAWVDRANRLLQRRDPGLTVPASSLVCRSVEEDPQHGAMKSFFASSPVDWLTTDTNKTLSVNMSNVQNQILALRLLDFYGRFFQTCWEHVQGLLGPTEAYTSKLVEPKEEALVQSGEWIFTQNAHELMEKVPTFPLIHDDAKQKFWPWVHRRAQDMSCERQLSQCTVIKGAKGANLSGTVV